jgi:hypothetical protein
MPELLLIPIMLRRFFEEPRNAMVAVMAIVVPLLSLWPHFSSPLLPAVAATFAVAEPYFMNMWCLWPREIEALALHPVRWERVVIAQNITALVLTALVYTLLASTVFYIHGGRIPLMALANGGIDCLIIGILLTIFGNSYSLVSPRPSISWAFDDLAAAVLAVIITGVFSIPLAIFTWVLGSLTGRIILIAIGGLLWARWSLPRTAFRLKHELPDIWTHTIQS